MAGRQLVQDVAGPGAGGVPAHVGEDQGALVAGQVGPRRPVAGAERLGQVEVDEHGPGARRAADHLGGRHRRVVPVGDHAAVPVDRHRDGHRRVPALEPAGPLQVDVLLLGQGAPAEVGVVVVAERRGQGGAQARAGWRRWPGWRCRPGRSPSRRPRPRCRCAGMLSRPVKTMSRKTVPHRKTSNSGPSGSRRAASGSYVDSGGSGTSGGSWGGRRRGGRRGHSARCASPLTTQNARRSAHTARRADTARR